jgi:hypothetical protein
MKTFLGPSWMPKLMGVLGMLASLGAAAGLLSHGNFNFMSPEWAAVGAGFSAALGNFASRQNNVTSEQAGAGATNLPKS